MSSSSSPSPATTGSIFTPLAIAIGGIISSSLAVVLYHAILLKYCHRGHHRQQHGLLHGIHHHHRNGRSLEIGLSRDELKTIPVLFFSERMKEVFRMDLNDCVICLGRLEKGDIIRWLPNCRHAFHLPCIDNWLHGHVSCPICRAPVVAPSTNPFPRSPNLRDLLAQVYVGSRSCSDNSNRDGGGNDMIQREHNELRPTITESQIPRLKRSFSFDHSSSSVVINIDVNRRGETEPHPPFVPLASKRMQPRPLFGFGIEQGGSMHGIVQC
ncbi:hypothetical protein Dimus_034681 [Dionaea muscipula]